MAFINIIFQNLQTGGGIPKNREELITPKSYFEHLRETEILLQSNEASSILGSLESGVNSFFFSESPTYSSFKDSPWSGYVPSFEWSYVRYGLCQSNKLKFCSYLKGENVSMGDGRPENPPLPYVPPTGSAILPFPPPEYFGFEEQILAARGTFQLPGSDRYGLEFLAKTTYPISRDSEDEEEDGVPLELGDPIRGLFVHIKNTHASEGFQIAALCRYYPDHIVFGDMNVNIREPLKKQALEEAVGGTHELLAIKNGDNYYSTHYASDGRHLSAIDYVLVPHAYVRYVSLGGFRVGGAVPRLACNGSDHSVMLLRIQCS